MSRLLLASASATLCAMRINYEANFMPRKLRKRPKCSLSLRYLLLYKILGWPSHEAPVITINHKSIG